MGASLRKILASPWKRWLLIVAVVAVVAGFVAWVLTLSLGLLDTTGLSNTFPWGLLIAVFAFLVGFGAGSQFVASYIVLSGRKGLQPYVMVAQSISLAGGCGAGVAILIDLASPGHLLSMLTGPNFASPIAWDMVSLTVFIVVSFICLLAVARESPHLKGWMVVGLIAAFVLQLVEGLLFALMEARTWWHSFFMPIDFLCVAVVCGLAIAALYLSFKRKDYPVESLRHIGRLLAWAIVVHIALALIDLALVAFGGTANDAGAMEALGRIWWLYAAELALPIAAAIVLACAVKSSKDGDFASATAARLLGAGGIMTILGMFCHRLMLLYPAFGSPTLFVGLSNQPSPEWALPASTGLYNQVGSAFELAQGYVPNLMEWAAALLPFGVAIGLAVVCVCAVELHYALGRNEK